MMGTDAADTLRGVGGHDTLFGARGDDVLKGNDGNDRLFGGTGHDRLFGADGNDILTAGGGRDTLVGGRGRDVMIGKEHDDLYIVHDTDLDGSQDVIRDGHGTNVLVLRDIAPGRVVVSRAGHDMIISVLGAGGGAAGTIRVEDQFRGRGVEKVATADGTVWNRATMERFADDGGKALVTGLRQAFGAKATAGQLAELRTMLETGTLPMPAQFVEVDDDVLPPGVRGAYSAAGGGTVYLAQSLVNAARKGIPEAFVTLVAITLEEIGHHIDRHVLGGRDAPGDEGAIFARAVLRGGPLGARELAALRAEEGRGESGSLVVGGERVRVEFFGGGFSSDVGMGGFGGFGATAESEPGDGYSDGSPGGHPSSGLGGSASSSGGSASSSGGGSDSDGSPGGHPSSGLGGSSYAGGGSESADDPGGGYFDGSPGGHPSSGLGGSVGGPSYGFGGSSESDRGSPGGHPSAGLGGGYFDGSRGGHPSAGVGMGIATNTLGRSDGRGGRTMSNGHPSAGLAAGTFDGSPGGHPSAGVGLGIATGDLGLSQRAFSELTRPSFIDADFAKVGFVPRDELDGRTVYDYAFASAATPAAQQVSGVVMDALRLSGRRLATGAAALAAAAVSAPVAALAGLFTLAMTTPAGEPPKEEEDDGTSKERGPQPTPPDIGPPGPVGVADTDREPTAQGPALADGLTRHFEERDLTVARRNGIGGAHNRQAFDQALAQEGGIVRSVDPHPTIEGIEKITYSLGTLDTTGVPTGQVSTRTFTKTTYDPSKISPSQMTGWTEQAANDAARRSGGTLGREWTGTANDGTAMRGYADDGTVTSAFPDF